MTRATQIAALMIYVSTVKTLSECCQCELIRATMYEDDNTPVLQFTCKDNTEAGIIKRYLIAIGLYYNAYPHKDYADRGTYFAVWAKPWPRSTPR